MMELAEHHMATEEEALFPLAEGAGSARTMGRAILRRREELAGSTTDVEGRA
jgi:hypothetical protein